MAENWKSKDWDALIRGERCPVCDLIHTGQREDEHGIAVADLQRCIYRQPHTPSGSR